MELDAWQLLLIIAVVLFFGLLMGWELSKVHTKGEMFKKSQSDKMDRLEQNQQYQGQVIQDIHDFQLQIANAIEEEEGDKPKKMGF